MGLVTSQKEWLDIPDEAGERVQIRPLSGSELREAEMEKTKATFRMLRDAEVRNLMDLANAAEDEEEPDPTGSYDHQTVVKYGLLDWTYDEDLNDESRYLLVASTQDWLVTEILRRSNPLLFEAGQKPGGRLRGLVGRN